MLNRVLRGVPLALVDRRSAVGVALRRTRDELVRQYGDVSPKRFSSRKSPAYA